MLHPSAPHTLRRFFDRVVHRSFGDLAFGDDPEHGPPDLPFFRRLVTEW